MTTATFQTVCRALTGTALSWNGDAHALCDLFLIPKGHLTERLGQLANYSPDVAFRLAVTASEEELYLLFGVGLRLSFVDGSDWDPRITVARAGAKGYVNDAGVLSWTPYNLLTYSEEFENAAWAKTNITAGDNTVIAPDGTLTGSTLIATSAGAQLQQTTVGTSGETYVTSFYIKRAIGVGAISIRATENVNVPITVTSEWTRVELAVAATTTTIRSGIYIATSGDAVALWAGQQEKAAIAGAYVKTTSSATSTAAIDYDFATLACLGLRSDLVSTNNCIRSNAFDNAAWTKTMAGAGTVAVVTPNYTTSPDGTNNAYRLQCNAGGATLADQSYIVSTGISTINPHAVGIGIWIKSNTGASQSVYFRNVDGTAGNTVTATTSWTRVRLVGDVSTAVSDNVIVGARGTLSDQSIDISIYNAQFEKQAQVSPDIITGASAVTIPADVISMTGTNFSDWYNQLEGCFVIKYRIDQRLAGMRVASVSDGTVNNFIEVIAGSATPPTVGVGSFLAVTTAAVSQVNSGGAAPTNTANTQRKVALGYKLNDFGFSNNGIAASTDTVGTVPTVDRFYIGASSIGASQPCCWVESITYYRFKPTSAQLATLSTP